eukprot:364218-Chlamydomonas_euryale.AAC.5
MATSASQGSDSVVMARNLQDQWCLFRLFYFVLREPRPGFRGAGTVTRGVQRQRPGMYQPCLQACKQSLQYEAPGCQWPFALHKADASCQLERPQAWPQLSAWSVDRCEDDRRLCAPRSAPAARRLLCSLVCLVAASGACSVALHASGRDGSPRPHAGAAAAAATADAATAPAAGGGGAGGLRAAAACRCRCRRRGSRRGGQGARAAGGAAVAAGATGPARAADTRRGRPVRAARKAACCAGIPVG